MSITFSYKGVEGINMNNRNGFDVLRFLGIEPECYGTISAHELANKAAQAIFSPRIDEGIASATYQEEGCATMVTGSRQTGYLRERAKQLAILAMQANLAGEREIYWG